jgi:hypothetical protein
MNPNYTTEECVHEFAGTDENGQPKQLRIPVGWSVLTADGKRFATLSTQAEAKLVASRLNADDGTQHTPEKPRHFFLDLSKMGRTAPVPYVEGVHPRP